MYRRPKAISKAKAKSKSLAEQGSGHGKNPIPAQLMKLRGEMIRNPFVKDSPTTDFKNEKSTCLAFFKEDKIPKCIVEPCIVSELPSSYPICNKFGHAPEQCPWRRLLPLSVTQVSKGYEINGWRVHILWCSFCNEIGSQNAQSGTKKKDKETDSWEEFFFPEDKDS
ncbi:hypothetical protein DVH24_033207 [Malus domestica]|uniref:Uncharacterized protein n=1 Tax=Malus domestica TaxID=3750 RepID=A0A498JFZ3_MALDO|nr:hypothetical protein DVH24_033207 [Malus domestica]